LEVRLPSNSTEYFFNQLWWSREIRALAVSGESSGVPGAFLTGANSSSLLASMIPNLSGEHNWKQS